MKKYKEDIKLIFKVAFFILSYLAFSIIKIPTLSYILVSILIVYWVADLYSNIQYLRGNANYIHFPTMNDAFSKFSLILIGIIILGFNTLSIVKPNRFNDYAIIGMVVGFFVLLKGIISLPNGRLKISEGLITVSHLRKGIEQKKMKEIHISREQLLLIPIDGEVKRVPNLDLDFKSAQLIQNYISNHQTNPDLVIINRLNPNPDVTNL